METSDVVAVESAPAAPVVTKTESSFTESKQESKVEQVTNGTVETATTQKKAVSQKVESSVQQISGGDASSVTVQEVKQESFSSSSVMMGDKPAAVASVTEQKPPIPEPAPVKDADVNGVNQNVTKTPIVNPNVQKTKEETPSESAESGSEETETESEPENEPVQVIKLAPPKPKPPVVVEEQKTEVVESVKIVLAPPKPKPTVVEEQNTEAVAETVKVVLAPPKPKPPVVEEQKTEAVETVKVVLAPPKPKPPVVEEQKIEAVVEAVKETMSNPETVEIDGKPSIAADQVDSVEKPVESEPKILPEPTNPTTTTTEELPIQQNEEKQDVVVISEQIKEKVVTTGDGLVVSVEPLSILPPIVETVVVAPPVVEQQPPTDVNNNVVAAAPEPAPKPVEVVAPAPVVYEKPAPPVEIPVEKPVEIPVQYHPEPARVAQTEAITKEITQEIQQENIKKQLNEIITDIEQHVNVNDEEPAENSNDGKLDVTNPVDLQKIFTPAHDTEEILPGKNRKLFASSSFYSPTIHPTVEDQVALAQRISHSLSDISNQQSKGQSMYVNRKKRSVKWIHDNGGIEEQQYYSEEQRETKENGYDGQMNGNVMEPRKVPLKLLMDPRGQMHGYEPQPLAPMSPEFGIELVNALNNTKGKGAELFAKRRKKAEKWVVDGNSVQQRTSSTTPSANSTILAYSDVGTQRVQRNIQMDQIQERYLNQQSRVKLVKSPWEAALETGSANNAFVNYNQGDQQQMPMTGQIYSATVGPNQQFEYGSQSSFQTQGSSQSTVQSSTTTKRDVQYQSSNKFSGNTLAYKPTVPQGWKRAIDLPVEDEACENEMSEIYDSTFNYLELIKSESPPPEPVIAYSLKCEFVEQNVYDEPVQELLPEPEREETPEYKPVPVKDLINTWEQGTFIPPDLPTVIHSSSTTTEKISKFTSQSSSSSSAAVPFSILPAPIQEAPAFVQAPAPAPMAKAPTVVPQQGPKPFMQKSPTQKPVQNSLPRSFPPPKSPVQFNQPPPKSPIHFNQAPQQLPPMQQPPMQMQQQQFQPKIVAAAPPPKMSPQLSKQRAGLNASPVTPGIAKKQIQLDAAVPRMPGSTGTGGQGQGQVPPKSPVPFMNTTPTPFGYQSGFSSSGLQTSSSITTVESLAQMAPISPAPAAMPRSMQTPKPLPLIVSTPIPKFSNNYNLAASGFGVHRDYYRPIHMENAKKLVPPVHYTDF